MVWVSSENFKNVGGRLGTSLNETEAKSSPNGYELPNKEFTFRALPSGTPQEKAEFIHLCSAP